MGGEQREKNIGSDLGLDLFNNYIHYKFSSLINHLGLDFYSFFTIIPFTSFLWGNVVASYMLIVFNCSSIICYDIIIHYLRLIGCYL